METSRRDDQLSTAVRKNQYASDQFDELFAQLMGINRTDLRCLDIIDLHEKVSAGFLAEESGLSTGAITTVIDRLEKAGYARRVPDPADRRKVLIERTALTEKFAESVYGQIGQLGEAVTGGFTKAEYEAVLRFLKGSILINTELAALLRAHIPAGAIAAEERLQRARGFKRDQKKLIARLAAQIETD